MLPQLEYLDDELDDEMTRLLREEQSIDDVDDDDPMVETQLMPAKHGAKSPTLHAHGRPRVPSPYPSAPKQYASGVQKKAVPPPPPPRAKQLSVLPDLFAELEASVESTGSDVRAPIHRLDGAPAMPSSVALAARQFPWAIQVTPPEFEPIAMPAFQPPVARHTEKTTEKPAKKSRGSAIFGGALGIACGVLIVSIANGTVTAKSARSALARATLVIDAVLAHH